MNMMIVVLGILLVYRGSGRLSPDEGLVARRHARVKGAS